MPTSHSDARDSPDGKCEELPDKLPNLPGHQADHYAIRPLSCVTGKQTSLTTEAARRGIVTTIINFISGLLVIAMLLQATGCQTVDTTHTQDVGSPKYPPSDPSQVQILRTEPTRPHVRLGEVRAEPSSESVNVSKIEEALRQEAAKLGADAAVVVYDRTQVTGAWVTGPWRDRSVQPIEGRVVIAIAIKYQ
jgi:hypothetical protein